MGVAASIRIHGKKFKGVTGRGESTHRSARTGDDHRVVTATDHIAEGDCAGTIITRGLRISIGEIQCTKRRSIVETRDDLARGRDLTIAGKCAIHGSAVDRKFRRVIHGRRAGTGDAAFGIDRDRWE